MKIVTLAIAAGAFAAVGFADVTQAHVPYHDAIPHTHHAHPGDWKSGGWTQWHNQPGFTQLGSVGTQLFQVHEKGVVGYHPHAWHGYSGYSYFYGISSPMMGKVCTCPHCKEASAQCTCPPGACSCPHHQHHAEKK
ncbi:MAG: hypothetical protein HQL76_13720 [Magnetococcales bacterium]|nr:hypothetical protein [Magnetococcales bacterium]